MTTLPYNYSYHASSALSGRLRAEVSRSKMLTAAHEKQSVALATGKAVNTPYDDSIRYFKDAHLSEKAQSIMALLDNISTVTTTLNSVDGTLSTLSELINLAKSAAEKAGQTPDVPASVTGHFAITETQAMSDINGVAVGDVLTLRLGSATEAVSSETVSKYDVLADFGIGLGEKFSVKIGSDDWTDITVTNENMTLDSFMKEIVATLGEDRVSYQIRDGRLTLSTLDQSGIIFGNRHYDATTQELIASDTTPSVAEKLGFSTETLITVEAGDTVRTFIEKINAEDGYRAFLNTRGRLVVESTRGEDIIVTDFAGTTASMLGVDSSSADGLHVRADEAENFNRILDQINELVEDSIFNGVNLLAGDDMRAVFNETATDCRRINGVKLDTVSLGLAYVQDSWASSESIADALSRLSDAALAIRQATQYFNRASAMVSSRETFLSALSETFQEGADSLTLADLNDVSAQLLAINTQRELTSNVLSLTLETDADVLSLF